MYNSKKNMFDYLKKKLQNTINSNDIKHQQIKEEVLNTLLEAEVCYDLAEKISIEMMEEFKINNNYKNSLYNAIIKNINDIPNNLKTGIILFIGFQGHGKTTNINKLAYRLKKKNFSVAVVTLDKERPAANLQLIENAERFEIPYLNIDLNLSIENIINEILKYKNDYQYIIVDTNGINPMNTESHEKIIHLLNPSEILLVMNSMLGHSMFSLLKEYKKNIKITGCIMTNVDGDKKGGGFLSFYYLMNCPILYISNGEKINHLEVFNPKSIVNIIFGELDMEGLQSLVEDNISKSVEETFMEKIMNGIFTFNELILFTSQTKKIGLSRIFNSIGINSINEKETKEKIKIMTSIFNSMTKKEKNNKVEINESRINRISKGSGNKRENIIHFLNSYEETKKSVLMITNMIKNGKDSSEIMSFIKNIISANK